MLNDMYRDWREGFENLRKSEMSDCPSSHCEHVGNDSYQITDQGMLARKDL